MSEFYTRRNDDVRCTPRGCFRQPAPVSPVATDRPAVDFNSPAPQTTFAEQDATCTRAGGCPPQATQAQVMDARRCAQNQGANMAARLQGSCPQGTRCAPQSGNCARGVARSEGVRQLDNGYVKNALTDTATSIERGNAELTTKRAELARVEAKAEYAKDPGTRALLEVDRSALEASIASLEANKKQLVDLQEGVRDGVWTWDEHRQSEANTAAAQRAEFTSQKATQRQRLINAMPKEAAPPDPEIRADPIETEAEALVENAKREVEAKASEGASEDLPAVEREAEPVAKPSRKDPLSLARAKVTEKERKLFAAQMLEWNGQNQHAVDKAERDLQAARKEFDTAQAAFAKTARFITGVITR